MNKYDNYLKYAVVNLVCNHNQSTSKIAAQFDIPLKTVENWITAYNKDNSCFFDSYQKQEKIIESLKHEIELLKKENRTLRTHISMLKKS